MVIQSNAPSRSDALPLGPIRMPLSRKSWVLIMSWVGPFVWSRVRFPVRFVGEHFPADEPAQLRRATTACNMPMVGVGPSAVGYRFCGRAREMGDWLPRQCDPCGDDGLVGKGRGCPWSAVSVDFPPGAQRLVTTYFMLPPWSEALFFRSPNFSQSKWAQGGGGSGVFHAPGAHFFVS